MKYSELIGAIEAGQIPGVRVKRSGDCVYILPVGRRTLYDAADAIVRAAGGFLVHSNPNFAVVSTPDAGELSITRRA